MVEWKRAPARMMGDQGEHHIVLDFFLDRDDWLWWARGEIGSNTGIETAHTVEVDGDRADVVFEERDGVEITFLGSGRPPAGLFATDNEGRTE